MARLARWCLRHRVTVLLLWLAALLAAHTAAAVHGSATSRDYGIPGTESARATALLRAAFPEETGARGTLVWHTERGTVHAPGVEQRMTGVLDRVAELPGVSVVRSPYQAAGAGQVSPDGHTAYATLRFAGEGGGADQERVQRVAEVAAAEADQDLTVALGGAGTDSTPDTGHLAEAVGLAAAAVVLFLAFGSLAATLLPILTALASVGTAYPLIGLLGHVLTVADFAPVLGVLVGLGVGIDYALFVLSRHRQGLRRGLSVPEAAEQAVATAGRAVVFAGVTVCIALLGMVVLRLGFLTGVAVAASLTVLLTVVAATTLLPALLGLLGTRVSGRRERRRPTGDGPPRPPAGLRARWSALVGRRPRLLAGLATAVMLLLALPTVGLHLGTADQGNDPVGSPTRTAYDLLADGFGPGVNGPLTVVGTLHGTDDAAAFADLRGTLRDTPGVAEVGPARFDAERDTAVLTVVPDSAPQDEATSALVGRLRGEVLPEALGGTTVDTAVGGLAAAHDDVADVVLDGLPVFCGTVVALGCLLLLVAFRSLAVPLKAAVTNVAAVASSFGVVVAVFQWGWGSALLGLGGAGPIEPFLPVVMVAVLFGLSMDYQVFLVSRIYEEWRLTGDNSRAVRVGLGETSRLINSAALIMIAVFGAFVLSGDRLVAMFGVGLATAVALDAFVLRTLLVPALMHLLGSANWWLPSWLARWLPRLHLAPVAPTPPGAGHTPVDGTPSAPSAAVPRPRRGPEGPPSALAPVPVGASVGVTAVRRAHAPTAREVTVAADTVSRPRRRAGRRAGVVLVALAALGGRLLWPRGRPRPSRRARR